MTPKEHINWKMPNINISPDLISDNIPQCHVKDSTLSKAWLIITSANRLFDMISSFPDEFLVSWSITVEPISFLSFGKKNIVTKGNNGCRCLARKEEKKTIECRWYIFSGCPVKGLLKTNIKKIKKKKIKKKNKGKKKISIFMSVDMTLPSRLSSLEPFLVHLHRSYYLSFAPFSPLVHVFLPFTFHTPYWQLLHFGGTTQPDCPYPYDDLPCSHGETQDRAFGNQGI